jgi:hypothetical protein
MPNAADGVAFNAPAFEGYLLVWYCPSMRAEQDTEQDPQATRNMNNTFTPYKLFPPCPPLNKQAPAITDFPGH